MTEPPEEEDNEFYELLTHLDTTELQEPDNSQLADGIQELFAETMQGMVVPEDEEQADAMMGDAITALMHKCFVGGMTYQYLYGPTRPDDEAFKVGVTIPPVGITPEMGTAIVLGLMNGEGVTLKLVVDRG